MKTMHLHTESRQILEHFRDQIRIVLIKKIDLFMKKTLIFGEPYWIRTNDTFLKREVSTQQNSLILLDNIRQQESCTTLINGDTRGLTHRTIWCNISKKLERGKVK